MREYTKEACEKMLVSKVICNGCGQEIPSVGDGLWQDYFHAEKSWGYFSDRDGDADCFDLCQGCYEKMIQAFAVKI